MKFYQYINSVLFFDLARSAVTPQGRLIEYPDQASFQDLDPITLQFLVKTMLAEANDSQVLFDLSQGWPLSIPTPKGTVNLDHGHRFDSYRYVTFASVQSREILIRFSHDCVVEESGARKMFPHPALHEFWFGHKTNRAGLGNRYHYVSAPVPFPSTPLFAGISAEHIRMCQEANAAVRFVIFHKPTGESLRSLLRRSPGEKLEPAIAFKIGRALTQSVRTLHTTGIAPGYEHVGIAHGDLSPDDVFVSTNAAGEVFIQFTGFLSLRGSWLDINGGKSLKRQLPPSLQPYLQSPWELIEGRSHHYSAQDELYRVAQLISIMLNGLGHENQLILIDKSIADFKLQTLVISISQSLSLPLSTEAKSVLISSLSTINARIFSMDMSSYDDIITSLEIMIMVVSIPELGAAAVSDRATFDIQSSTWSTPAETGESVPLHTDPGLSALTALAALASNQPDSVGQSGAVFGLNLLAGGNTTSAFTTFKSTPRRRGIPKPSSSPSK